MIERIDNIIQLIVLGICMILALNRALRSGKRAWAILGMFYGTVLLGNLYWILYLMFYGETPFYSFIPDMSWCAGYLFLMLLLFQIRDGKRNLKYVLLLLPTMAFTGAMALFYIRVGGEILTNIFYAVIMALILWQALAGLFSVRGQRDNEKQKNWLYLAVLLFLAAEYALWTASCYWMGDTIRNPYYWFDFLLSASYLLMLPAVKRGVDR